MEHTTAITIEAVYENGVLKPKTPLPFHEHTKVEVTVQPMQDVQAALAAVERSHALFRSAVDAATLERIALEDEFGVLEAP